MRDFKNDLDKSLQELFERIMAQSSQESSNFQRKADEAIEVIIKNIEQEARKQLAIALAKGQSQQAGADIAKMKAGEDNEVER